MRSALVMTLCFLVLVPGLVSAADLVRPVTLRGHCMAVPAADVLRVWLGPEQDMVLVRLVGVDRLSLEGSFPRYSRLLTRTLALDRQVRVEVFDKDARGTITGRVIVDHEDLSYLLIAEGLARYNGNAPAVLRLEEAETAAREHGAGLWAAERQAERARAEAQERDIRLPDIAWKVDFDRAARPEAPSGDSVTADGLEASLGTWIGAPTSRIMARLGRPSRIEADGLGGTILVYERCPPGGPVERTRGDRCSVLLFADADGVIYDRIFVTSP